MWFHQLTIMLPDFCRQLLVLLKLFEKLASVIECATYLVKMPQIMCISHNNASLTWGVLNFVLCILFKIMFGIRMKFPITSLVLQSPLHHYYKSLGKIEVLTSMNLIISPCLRIKCLEEVEQLVPKCDKWRIQQVHNYFEVNVPKINYILWHCSSLFQIVTPSKCIGTLAALLRSFWFLCLLLPLFLFVWLLAQKGCT